MEGVAGIAALATCALWRSEEAEFFVVADGGGVEAGAASEFTDFHFRMLSGCESLNALCQRLAPGYGRKSGSKPPNSKALDLKLALSFSIQEWDVANPNWRKAMNGLKEQFGKASKRKAATAGAALALLIAGGEAAGLAAQGSAIIVEGERQVATTQSKFYCNTKALTPEERARHKQLSEKLAAARKEIVETEKGYEFQYSPADISLAELAEWVGAESKCCPFFDFHIDVEREGKLLCLRLTGEEEIKAFIRAEFGVEKMK